MGDLIADYTDGAGHWQTFRDGDTLTIMHPNDGALPYALTRAPEYDAQYSEEWALSSRYAACDDYGTNGIVWIDGIAYALEGVPGVSAPWKVGDSALYQGVPVTITSDDVRTFGGRAYSVKSAAGQWAVTTSRHLKPVCCNGAQHSYAGDCIARAAGTMWAATTD